MDLPDVLPARHPDLEVAEFETEFVVFDPRNKMAHLLPGLSAFVFDGCDGVTPSITLLEEMAAVGTWSSAESREQLRATLAELDRLGLLEGSEVPVPPPCIGCGGGPERATHRRRARR